MRALIYTELLKDSLQFSPKPSLAEIEKESFDVIYDLDNFSDALTLEYCTKLIAEADHISLFINNKTGYLGSVKTVLRKLITSKKLEFLYIKGDSSCIKGYPILPTLIKHID